MSRRPSVRPESDARSFGPTRTRTPACFDLHYDYCISGGHAKRRNGAGKRAPTCLGKGLGRSMPELFCLASRVEKQDAGRFLRSERIPRQRKAAEPFEYQLFHRSAFISHPAATV